MGDQLIDLQLTSDFFGEANYKERYKRMETVDKAIFNEREVYRVKCQSQAGKLSVAMFDVETGFVIGAQTTMTSDEGAKPTILALLDYEDIGGMMWPKNIIQFTPDGETRISYREITVNEVDESVFDRPEAVDQLAEQYEEKTRKPGG